MFLLSTSLFLLGVELLLELDAELLAERLELIEVLLVLRRRLDLGLDSYTEEFRC